MIIKTLGRCSKCGKILEYLKIGDYSIEGLQCRYCGSSNTLKEIKDVKD